MALFEENSILPLPECLEASGVKLSWGEVSQRMSEKSGGNRPIHRPIFTEFYRFLPIFRAFLGDFTPGELDSRSLQTLWEWRNRVLLEEYYVVNVAILLGRSNEVEAVGRE